MEHFKQQLPFRQLRVHFGDACNLNCSFCHSKPLKEIYHWNPNKIVQYYNDNNFNACSCVGGEPTLYINQIVELIRKLPYRSRNSYTTNGTTMEGDVLTKTLRNRLYVSVSINEFTLDKIKYNGVRQIYRVGTSCVWDGKHTLDEIDEMVAEFSERLGYVKFPYYNLVHSTPYNHFSYTDKQIQQYLGDLQKRLELACRAFNKNKVCQYSMVLSMLNQIFRKKKPGCFRIGDYITMNTDGTFTPCSYSNLSFDIAEKAEKTSFQLLSNFKCSTCIVPKDQCSVCMLSTNDTECYIMRETYKIYMHTLKKYRINYNEVYDKLSWYPFNFQGGIHNGFGDSL